MKTNTVEQQEQRARMQLLRNITIRPTFVGDQHYHEVVDAINGNLVDYDSTTGELTLTEPGERVLAGLERKFNPPPAPGDPNEDGD